MKDGAATYMCHVLIIAALQDEGNTLLTKTRLSNDPRTVYIQ